MILDPSQPAVAAILDLLDPCDQDFCVSQAGADTACRQCQGTTRALHPDRVICALERWLDAICDDAGLVPLDPDAGRYTEVRVQELVNENKRLRDLVKEAYWEGADDAWGNWGGHAPREDPRFNPSWKKSRAKKKLRG